MNSQVRGWKYGDRILISSLGVRENRCHPLLKSVPGRGATLFLGRHPFLGPGSCAPARRPHRRLSAGSSSHAGRSRITTTVGVFVHDDCFRKDAMGFHVVVSHRIHTSRGPSDESGQSHGRVFRSLDRRVARGPRLSRRGFAHPPESARSRLLLMIFIEVARRVDEQAAGGLGTKADSVPIAGWRCA